MRDHVFTGADVAEALAAAAANLGLPLAELRYVVLDAGQPGGRGLSASPARVAVVLESAAPSESRPAPRAAAEPADPRAGIVETIRAIAAAGELSVSAEIEETEEALRVDLRGEDRAFFLEPDDRADVLRATEHLLLRLYGAALQPLALRVTGAGFRERRDAALVAEARRVAEAVRGDGRARPMPALNSYERRVVHLALQDEHGIATASEGEGAERRLTISPLGPAGEPAAE